VGISSTDSGATDPHELLHQAVTALGRQDAPGQRVRVYDQELRADALHQLDMEALVRRTVDAGRVELAYQPVVRLEDQAVEGGEALLRLVDAAGDPVSPLDVIAAADRLGAIGELSHLILATACREAAGWREAAPGRPVLLSINVPGTLLADPAFPTMVSDVVAEAGLAPSSLCLEVNESVLMEDPLRSATQLVDLKMRGFRLAVDDFGTGYSSLAHLKRFPLDILKVDRSLTRGLAHSLEDTAIVRAIIGVADALGLSVVAEGVEDEEQRRELEVLGVAYGQGFLWSGAMRPESFGSLLSADRDRREATADARPTGRTASRPVTPAPGVQENLDAVLSVLAHEIRTPLSVITGYASLLEQSLGTEEADAAATIARAGQRISRILANIVDADSAMEGSLQLRLHAVDLGALVGRLVDDLAAPVARAVSYTPPVARHPVAMVDGTRIEQTVNNLITNAVKYSPPGSPVLVEVDVGADWLDVLVMDEGPGIPPEQIGLIFRKYGRASARVPGTGLGLYLARSIARAHGGEVLYRRRTDRSGSVFVLRLPRMATA
jgi:EAL domain-containing protein (putative c-di-GMP-specific phosphodiesterase class I)